MKAHIDKSKCVNCGRCAQVCPYSAIANRKRPCENACKVKAIGMAEDTSACIDYNKCISCGACVYQCPFGAITDKSLHPRRHQDAQGERTTARTTRVYAVVAPSISSQFTYAKLGQVITGIQELGFFHVVEAALGADMVAQAESQRAGGEGLPDQLLLPGLCRLHQEELPQLCWSMCATTSPPWPPLPSTSKRPRLARRSSSSGRAPRRRRRCSWRRSSRGLTAR